MYTQNEKRWGSANEIGGGRMFIQELRGKTVGVIGYGHVRVSYKESFRRS
jgi:phosphoglycerate dehydrogenase-like enzyme